MKYNFDKGVARVNYIKDHHLNFFKIAAIVLTTLNLGVNSFAACTATTLEADLKKGSASCKTYDVNKTIYIRSKVNFDGKGAKITGVGTFKQCDKYPSSKAVFWIESSRNVLKNFTIVTSPEGIHVATGVSNVLENITFAKVCEDAITNGNKTSNSATKTIVSNCKFYNGTDKAIQSNGGTMLVDGSEFSNILRPISTCGNSADGQYHDAKLCRVKSVIYVQNTKFVNSRSYAMQAAGEKSSLLYARNNKFINVPTAFRTQQTGKIYSSDSACKSSSTIICNKNKTNEGFKNF